MIEASATGDISRLKEALESFKGRNIAGIIYKLEIPQEMLD